MSLFGFTTHEDRLKAIESYIRGATERLNEIEAHVAETQIGLLELRNRFEHAEAGIDPAISQLNDALRAARNRIDESRATTDAGWSGVQQGVDDAFTAFHDGYRKAAGSRAEG